MTELHITMKSTADADERLEGVRAAAERLYRALGSQSRVAAARVAMRCDSCGVESLTMTDTIEQAVALVTALGWCHSPDTGDDWCPSCLAKP